MDAKQLKLLLHRYGYFGEGLSDEAKYESLDYSFWKNIPKEMHAKLRAVLWKNIGKKTDSWIDSLFAVDLKKAAPFKGSPKTAMKTQATQLANLYTIGSDKIKALVEQAFISGKIDNLESDTDALREKLLTQGNKWIDYTIPGLYLKGSGSVSSKAHADSIASQIELMQSSLLEADQNIGNYIRNKIAEYKQLKAKNTLARTTPAIDTRGIKDNLAEMVEGIKNEDIPGKKTIDGKVLGLAAFVASLAITISRNAYNEGVENVALEDGTDLVQISANDSYSTCDYCTEWSGKIVSVSGANPHYPSLEDAYAGGCFHVNCKHYLIYLDKHDIKTLGLRR